MAHAMATFSPFARTFASRFGVRQAVHLRFAAAR
jgi:hypothetical protein